MAISDVGRVVPAVLMLLLAALVAGQLLGQPILLTYVTSDSMEPTIDEGDGFIAVPAQLSGDISEGDVIVFNAKEVGGGGLTTHRVVGETEEGYITKGDGNPFTDQSGGEPVVTEGQVVATAVQLNGWVITIPELGTAILTVRNQFTTVTQTVSATLGIPTGGTTGTGILLSGLGVALFGLSWLRGARQSNSRRSRTRTKKDSTSISGWRIVLFLVLIIGLPANITMLSASGANQVAIEGGDELTGGDDFEGEATIANGGFISMTVFFDSQSQSMSVSPQHVTIPPGESRTVTVSGVTPPPGQEQVFVLRESYYLRILPTAVLRPLHTVHPWLALGAINVTMIVVIISLVGGTIGLKSRQFREVQRDVPLRLQIRRALRWR